MKWIVFCGMLSMFATTASAQPRKGRCTGVTPDSAEIATAQIFLDCEVDKSARLKSNEPRIAFAPNVQRPTRDQGFSAEFQFVVDTLGAPELSTVQGRPTTDTDLSEAVLPVLGQLRYEPATIADRPVRQIVLTKRTVRVMVLVVSSGPGGSSSPPPSSRMRPNY